VTEEIHDMSRVDSFMASRRRAMFFHSVWKPMLAGAVGAAIMSAAVIGSVWVILPKISTRDIVVDHVIQKDVPFDNHVPQPKPFDLPVPQPKPFDLPVPAPKPVADAKPVNGPEAPYAAKTPDETKFVDRPDYKDAAYRGRIVKSRDGRALSFEDGKSFVPLNVAPDGSVTDDMTRVMVTDQFVGDLGMCTPRTDNARLWNCVAFHNGQVVSITSQPKSANADLTPPTQPSTDSGGPTVAAANWF
jgi:hypothetical protein